MKRPASPIKPVLATLIVTAVAGCGGAAGTRDTTQGTPGGVPVPDPPLQLHIIDSVPGDNATGVLADVRGLAVVHSAPSSVDYTYSGGCSDMSAAVVRRLSDDLPASAEEIVTHHLTCSDGLAPASEYAIDITGTNDNAAFETTLGFTSGEPTQELQMAEERHLSSTEVATAFTNYVDSALIESLGLSSVAELAVRTLLIDIASSEWRHLADPEPGYPVTLQRVHYSTAAPDGTQALVSGLVSFPDLSDDDAFTPRDRIILLSHATGSTPSDMDSADAWFILAGLLATRGYLVITADNYGRGLTAANPETYLLGKRTALQSLDLLRHVVSNNAYEHVYGGVLPAPVSVIGYSQGGHSAIATWLEMTLHHRDIVTLVSVDAGGGPHQLYRTVRGVIRSVAGACNDDPYCVLVNPEASVPFATARILPAMGAYVLPELDLDAIVAEGMLSTDFVERFLEGDDSLGDLRTALQANSYGNLDSSSPWLSDASTTIHLYHSPFDRLVPQANTLELRDALAESANVVMHSDECASDGFALVFAATDEVGAVHTLCALNVMDRILERLN